MLYISVCKNLTRVYMYLFPNILVKWMSTRMHTCMHFNCYIVVQTLKKIMIILDVIINLPICYCCTWLLIFFIRWYWKYTINTRFISQLCFWTIYWIKHGIIYCNELLSLCYHNVTGYSHIKIVLMYYNLLHFHHRYTHCTNVFENV